MKKETALHIPVSSYCNNDCRFCMEPRVDTRVNLNKKFIFGMLEKYRFEKADRVLFTNKEPTLNPDLIHYIKYARKLGFKNIALVTNGRRLSFLKYCQDLLKNGLNHITVSIHGHNSLIHDYLTRRKGSFEQTLNALKNLNYFRNRLPFTLITSTVLSKVNYLYMKEILMLLSRFNIDQIIMQIIECRGRKMGQSFFPLMPKYSEVAKEIEKVDRECSGIRFHVIGFPFCILRKEGKNYVSGYTENIKRLFVQNNKEKLRLFDYSSEYSTVKRKKCQQCKFYYVCRGVFRPYIKHFGWKEFQPITKL